MPLLPRSACSRDDSAISRSATPSSLAQSRLQLRLWFLACLAAGPLAAATGRPNLLFILTEDQGAQLSFVGTPGLQTPHMDSLARTGVYFNRAYVAYPVCSASKAAIYTGLHNHANGILNNTLNYHKPAAKVTAAEREPIRKGQALLLNIQFPFSQSICPLCNVRYSLFPPCPCT